MMEALNVVAIIVAGLMVGSELAIATFVPRKNTRNVGSAWTNSMTCTYFVPFCARAKIGHSR